MSVSNLSQVCRLLSPPEFFLPYYYFFFSLEEADHEIHLMMQFLIPSRLLVFESRDDRRVLLRQDQRNVKETAGTFGGFSRGHWPFALPQFGARRFGTTCTRSFLHLL